MSCLTTHYLLSFYFSCLMKSIFCLSNEFNYKQVKLRYKKVKKSKWLKPRSSKTCR